MKQSGLVIGLVFSLMVQGIFVSSCYGQTATKGNPPKVAPVGQSSATPAFTPEQTEKIREVIKQEIVPLKEKIDPWIDLQKTMLWVVGIIVTSLLGITGIAIWQSVGGLKKRAKAKVEETEEELKRAQKFVEEIQTIRDNAKKQAEAWTTELQAQRIKIIAASGKPLSHRPRYVLTQGGSIEEPSWEFDMVLLFTTKDDSSTKGLLRTSGGSKFNTVREEEKEWQECTITLNKDKSISLERCLTGTLAGNTQTLKGRPCSAPKVINGHTAAVWEGQWSGYSAEGVPGALIVYLD